MHTCGKLTSIRIVVVMVPVTSSTAALLEYEKNRIDVFFGGGSVGWRWGWVSGNFLQSFREFLRNLRKSPGIVDRGWCRCGRGLQSVIIAYCTTAKYNSDVHTRPSPK